MIERDIKSIPVFCIPAGHGIGFTTSILGVSSPLVAAFSITKGFRRKLDVIKVVQDNSLLCHSTTLLGWGAIADVEFNTSKLRWLGPVRYHVGAVASMRNPNLFHFKISYLPAIDESMTFCTGEGCDACKKGAERAANIDGNLKAQSKDWVVMEGYFAMIVAMNVIDSTNNYRFAPFAHPSDGSIDLIIFHDISRADLVDLYSTLRSGNFVDKTNFASTGDKLTYVKVEAFKIEPLSMDEPIVISIDGLPYTQTSTIECTVMPSAFDVGS